MMRKFIAITLTIMIAFSFMPGLAESAHAAAKKPAKVKFAKCTSTKSSATLKWKKAKNAKKYEVYQLKAKKYKKIKTVKKTKFTVKKLKANTVYRFKVRAVNGKKKGKFSAVKKIRTKKVNKKSNNTNVTPAPQGSISDVYFANNSTSVKVGKSVTTKLLIEVKGNAKPVASNFTVRTQNVRVAASVTRIGGGMNKSYYASVKITGKAPGRSVVIVSGYGFSDSIDVHINANTSSGNSSNNNNNENTSSNNTNTNSGNENGNGQTNGVALQSISFNKSSMEMAKGDYQTLNLSYSPSNTTVDKKNIKYSVSDSNVLSINSSGSTSVSIKSVGYGTATVTATLDGKAARCTVTVPKPEPKYSYEIYKLENQDIYYDYNNILIKEPYYKYSKGPLLVITDNPKPNDYENGYISSIVPYDYSAEDGNYVSCFGEFKKPSELKNKYYDIMNIPDRTTDGKYVYYVFGTIFKEDADKPFVVCEQDQYSGTIKTTTRKWDLNIKSYVDDFHNWLDEIISANDGGNPPERMSKIATYLKNYASYNPTGYPYYCIDSSLKLNTLSTWKARYWDSKYYAPHYYVGQKLGFTNITEQTGKLHAFVKMDWNGETYSYSITPNQNNVKLISEYCPQLSLADYRIINSH